MSIVDIATVPCKTPRCRTCRHVPSTEGITTPKGTTIYPQTLLTCETTQIIYLIMCKRCHKRYVGETARSLRERMWGHRHDIMSKKKDKSLGEHFNQRDHLGIHDVLACPITALPPDTPTKKCLTLRRDLEQFFIQLFESAPPLGLNRTEDCQTRKIPIVLPYERGAQKWFNTVKKLWEDFIRPTYPAVFSNYHLLPAYKRGENLGEKLAKAKDKGRPTQLTTQLLEGNALRILSTMAAEVKD